MATKRRNSDTIDLTTSPTLSVPFPVPSTSRNRRPRSVTSSRIPKLLPSRSQSATSGTGDDSSVASAETIDAPLLLNAEEGQPCIYPIASASTQLRRRKRRRVDVSGTGEEKEHKLHDALQESNLTEGISEASMSSQVAANPLSSSRNLSLDFTSGSPSFSLHEELDHGESPPLTQQTVVSWANTDAGADISEVSVLTQRGTPLSIPETNGTSDDIIVILGPVSPPSETPLMPATTDVTSDDVVVISPALPSHGTPSSLHSTIIDDSIPLDMTLSSTPKPAASYSLPETPVNIISPPSSAPEPLSAYTCPICFSPPTNATMTSCGHICCGACLFAAVKSMMKRNMVIAMDRAPVARCPVCRAEIPGWDGRGGGVVGLKVQVVYSL